MSIKEIEALMDSRSVQKEGFRLKWIDNLTNDSDRQYNIHFHYVDISDTVENGMRFWSVEYIHRYRTSDRIYPISFLINSRKKILEISVKLPTVTRWVKMKFPLAEMELIPRPTGPQPIYKYSHH